MNFTKKALGLAALALAVAYNPAQAAYFVSTGQTGAQVQTDINHTQHWTLTVGGSITIDGANFTMKEGPSTTADISFVIFQGVYQDYLNNSFTPLFATTYTHTQFGTAHGGNVQSFDWVKFNNPPQLTLLPGITYTGVLYSSAVDTQSTAYFIKGGSTTPLSFVDENGNSVNPVPMVTSVPEPSSIALLLATGLLVSLARPRVKI